MSRLSFLIVNLAMQLACNCYQEEFENCYVDGSCELSFCFVAIISSFFLPSLDIFCFGYEKLIELHEAKVKYYQFKILEKCLKNTCNSWCLILAQAVRQCFSFALLTAMN